MELIKLRELNASFKQAHVTVCKLVDLNAILWNCIGNLREPFGVHWGTLREPWETIENLGSLIKKLGMRYFRLTTH